MSEAEMFYGEALLWIEALEWFIRREGLTVPTWAEMTKMGWKYEQKPTVIRLVAEGPITPGPGSEALQDAVKRALGTVTD